VTPQKDTRPHDDGERASQSFPGYHTENDTHKPDGSTPTVSDANPETTGEETRPCFFCGKPTTYLSPAGYWGCDECRGDIQYALDGIPDNLTDPRPEPVDLRTLMSSDPPEQVWLIEPFVLAGKHTGIIATRGERKSLLTLDLVARRSTGQAVLDQPAGDPIHVVYLDMEMGPDDLWDRLDSFGWTIDNPNFDTLVEHLHYYQLIDLAPLDTEEGGIALEAIVAQHDATVVVIDTVIRVIAGGENDNDTFKDLFRHTETRLKRKGVTLLRLDHLGKDEKKGSRGASAKEDALDVVYQIKGNDKGDIRLTKTKGRQDGLPEVVKIEQEYDNGVLRHVIPLVYITEETMGLVFEIDRLDLPDDASTRTVQKALQAKGDGRRRTDIGKAVAFRKGRKHTVSNVGTTPGTTHREPPPEPPGTTTEETTDNQGKRSGNHPGNHPEPSMGTLSPPYKGESSQTPKSLCDRCDHPIPGAHRFDCSELPDPA
jgi:hypothetical protein